MAGDPARTVQGQLERLLTVHAQQADQDLLRRYTGGDQEAFAALLERHGPMVFGVCRRRLVRHQDAEEAFQATFLALARKASSLTSYPSLGPWLHVVACRVSGKLRASILRRQQREKPMPDLPEKAGRPADLHGQELQDVLDEELARLPERFRAPMVLCYLQGKTNNEAARELGCSRGSVSGWLARGRELLRQRLLRRGLVLTPAAVLSALTQPALAALPSATLKASTLQAVGGVANSATLALAEGALQGAYPWKLALVLCCCLLGGGGFLLWAGLSEPGKERQTPDPKTAQPVRRVWRETAVFPLEERDGAVYQYAFSPDGGLLAMALAGGGVRLWDLNRKCEAGVLRGHLGQVIAVAFAPDGKTLASICDEPQMILWNVADRTIRWKVPPQKAPAFPQGWSLAYSADGKSLLTSPFDQSVTEWDIENGVAKRTTQSNEFQIQSLSVVGDRGTIATLGRGELRLWDLKTGKTTRTIRTGMIHDLTNVPDFKAIIIDGRMAASFHGRGPEPKELRLWDVANGAVVHRLSGFEEALTGCTFSPDGKSLAIACADGSVHFVEVSSGKRLQTLAGKERTPLALPLRFSPDGTMLAAGSFAPRLWSLKPARD